VKAALSVLGLCEEKYRLPLVPLKETDKEKLKNIMESYFLVQS
jgi:dihydrodipicolinate synthase/N-acetylneuraminate lyase